jgi:hypothetical protein
MSSRRSDLLKFGFIVLLLVSACSASAVPYGGYKLPPPSGAAAVPYGGYKLPPPSVAAAVPYGGYKLPPPATA